MKRNSLCAAVAAYVFLAGIWFLLPAEVSAQKPPITSDRTAEYVIGEGPEFSVFDETYVWIPNQFSDNVIKINPSNGNIVGNFTVTGNPLGIAYDGKSIWVSRYAANSVVSLDKTTGAITKAVTTNTGPGFLLYANGSIWVANRDAKSVQRINPSTNSITATYAVGKRPAMMASDGTNVWVANSQSHSVSRINAATGAVATFALSGGHGAFGVAFDGTNIWVSNFFGGTLEKVSPAGASLGTIKIGDGLAGMFYSNGYMWVVANGENLVYRVRLLDGAITSSYQVSQSPYGLLFDGTKLWTQASGSGKVSVITPATTDIPQ